jgi:L-iditol 2-dehydrogenase
VSGRTMRAAVLHAPGDLRIERVPVPAVGPADALVRVSACGICGSDVPRVRTTGTYRFPTIPGHEMAGVIEALGPQAAAARPGIGVGMPVAVVPLVPCGRCRFCEIGAFAQCEAYDFLGSRSDGGFAEYVRAPAASLVPLPDGLAAEQGALLEPVTVALHAVRNLGIGWGMQVAVFGLGAIGNFIAQWARAFGARGVFALDVAARKVEIARQVGLDEAMDATGLDVPAVLKERTAGTGVDAAFDASGSARALEQAVASLAAFGRLGLVGRPPGEVTLPAITFEKILRGEITLRGTWSFTSTRVPHHPWEEAARAIAAGVVRTGPLVTHRIPLEDLPGAIDLMARGDASFHKILVLP